jgi:hypothetical protein
MKPKHGAVTRPQALTIIAHYPNFSSIDAGGTFIGWHHSTSRGGYILITNERGEGLPRRTARRVMVGRYNAQDTAIGKPAVIPVTQLEAWIDEQLGLKQERK